VTTNTGVDSGYIPKRIWIYWSQGLEKAPQIVKLCVESWRKLNPEYEVSILSDANLELFISPGEGLAHFDQLTIQKRSNIIRKQLLLKFGGVWVDATVLCIRPLREWLLSPATGGFILLKNDNPDRVVCNWFIAANQGNTFIEEWLRSTLDYFSRSKKAVPPAYLSRIHNHILASTKKGGWGLRFWTSHFGKRVWPAYPYFISHYLAAEILSKDFYADSTSSIVGSSWGPWQLSRRVREYRGDQITDFIKDVTGEHAPPLMKLNHRASLPETQLVDSVTDQIWNWLESSHKPRMPRA
jgi:hypothetical protein